MNTRLNTKLLAVQESSTLRLNALAKQLALSGRKIVNLTAGELDFATPKEIAGHVGKHLHLNKYTPNLGILELRQAIAQSLGRKYRLKLSEQNVAVTAGAKQGLFLVFQTLLNPRDEVIVPIPGWVSYEHQVRLCGGKPVLVPLTNKFDLDLKVIKKAINKNTKAIVLNSPHNPTGAVFSPNKVRELLAMANKYKIFVIADEIYATLVYEPGFISVLKMKPNFSSLILIDGFSKSHALTGWRIGYVVADPLIISSFNKILSHTSGNVSILSQHAALASLKHPNITKEFVKKLKKRRALVASLLADIPKLDFIMPKGAFYFFVNIQKISRNSEQFAERLLKEVGLAVVPGEAFGTPGFLRLSFATSEIEIRQGLRLLKNFVQQ